MTKISGNQRIPPICSTETNLDLTMNKQDTDLRFALKDAADRCLPGILFACMSYL